MNTKCLTQNSFTDRLTPPLFAVDQTGTHVTHRPAAVANEDLAAFDRNPGNDAILGPKDSDGAFRRTELADLARLDRNVRLVRLDLLTGSHRASVSSGVVSEMVEAFRGADYFSLKDKYMWWPTDLATYKTSISIDGRTKEVVDYAGQQVGMPASVSKLEETIDRLSGVERWTKGNGETVPALMQEQLG